MRIALLLIPVLTACGPKSPPDTTTTPTEELTPTEADLEGRWRSDCVDPGTGQGFDLEFDISRESWALDYTAYGDVACEVPFLTVHIEGPYDLLDASTDVEGARQGNFHFAERTVTPHMDMAVDFLTEACGVENFASGEATDILAEGCPGLGAYPVQSCSTDHDIVIRDGDTLTFGARPANNDMCTPENRPEALGLPLTLQ
jgi:hypothetical protein